MNKLIPISSSILRNRRELSDAIWTFLWLINQTTQIRACQDGQLEGLVSEGEKLKVELIAEDLGLSPSTVRRHIRVLQKAGLVRKMGSGMPSGFALPAESVRERARC